MSLVLSVEPIIVDAAVAAAVSMGEDVTPVLGNKCRLDNDVKLLPPFKTLAVDVTPEPKYRDCITLAESMELPVWLACIPFSPTGVGVPAPALDIGPAAAAAAASAPVPAIS